MVTEAIEERLRLRLRLLLTWKIRAAELLRNPESCPVEEFPPNLALSLRTGWLQSQQASAQTALNHFRNTLKQRATRFTDLARTYAYRRDRLPEKVAEGTLTPVQANEASRQLLQAIEAYTRFAALCGSLAEMKTPERIGGPVKLRLCRYEAELERFGSLSTLLETLEQSIGQGGETSPGTGGESFPRGKPPENKSEMPRYWFPRIALWLRRPGQTDRYPPRRIPGPIKQLNLTQGDLLVLGATILTLSLLGAVAAWYYVFSVNLRVEVSPVPDRGFRLTCTNRGIRPIRLILPEIASRNQPADIRVRIRRNGSDPNAENTEPEITGRWRPVDQAGSGPIWHIPPMGSAAWDFTPNDPVSKIKGLRLEVLSARGRILYSLPLP